MSSPHTEKSETWRILLLNSFALLLDVTEIISGYEILHETLKNYCDDTILEMVRNTYKRNDNHLNVLCHGDLWANNIMFTHSPDGIVQDVLLVDFQLANLNTPASDLAFLIFSSFHDDLDESSWNELLKYYHTILTQTLDKFEYKDRTLTLRQLHEQFLSQAVLASLIGLITNGGRRLENVNADGINVFISQTEEGRKLRVDMNI